MFVYTSTKPQDMGTLKPNHDRPKVILYQSSQELPSHQLKLPGSITTPLNTSDPDSPAVVYISLDPEAPLATTPSDGDAGKFTLFIFGVPPLPFFALSLSFAATL